MMMGWLKYGGVFFLSVLRKLHEKRQGNVQFGPKLAFCLEPGKTTECFHLSDW